VTVSDADSPCLRCGAPLKQVARFCIRCGAPRDGGGGDGQTVTPPLDRWREWKGALQLWIVLIASSGGLGLVMKASGSDSPSFDVAGAILVAVAVLAFAARVPRAQLLSLLDVRRVGARAIATALALTAALVAFIYLYTGTLERLGLEVLNMSEPFEASGWPLWSTFVLLAVCPAVFEEIAFRGVIYHSLVVVGGRREALILQASMFSIIHLLPAIFVSHFVIGLVLGWQRERTGSLLPCMITHALYNGALVSMEIWG
jgi:uncharacterized protein